MEGQDSLLQNPIMASVDGTSAHMMATAETANKSGTISLLHMPTNQEPESMAYIQLYPTW